MKPLHLLPLSRLNAALASIGYPRHTDKQAAVDAVNAAIGTTSLTLASVNSGEFMGDSTPSGTAITAMGAAVLPVSTPRIEAVEAMLSRLQSTIESVSLKVDAKTLDVASKVELFAAEMADAVECFTKSSPAVSFDAAAITDAVRAEVAAILEPFKLATPVAVLEAVAESVVLTTTKTAREVFPDQVLKYTDEGESVDFSNMKVTLWGDTQAPELLDDYVFNPMYLHQSLIAINNSLPLSSWLAGERGTGKTEFVSQLAARLQRKLFRINFDEAIERADFIGGNTISGGDVVWKEGVLTQAIQHQGALVLFDEIGFARPQSIAVLHSICEPSVHRAVVVNETGKRIPVHKSVAFFCADNSNGHGDDQGSYAGVRDQNSAFIDRFAYTFMFDYLPVAQESTLISKRTGVNKEVATMICKLAAVAREKARSGMLTQPPSLRQLFAFAIGVRDGMPVASAYKSAVINKYPADCTAELKGIFTAAINVAAFKKALES
jgi:hypothetical protein